MNAHFDFQIPQQHQQSTFHGPSRQFGSSGMGAFALRMGRVAMPLMKQYIFPVSKELGRNQFRRSLLNSPALYPEKGDLAKR